MFAEKEIQKIIGYVTSIYALHVLQLTRHWSTCFERFKKQVAVAGWAEASVGQQVLLSMLLRHRQQLSWAGVIDMLAAL